MLQPESPKASDVGALAGFRPSTGKSASGSFTAMIVVLAHWGRCPSKAPENKRLREPPTNHARRVTGDPHQGTCGHWERHGSPLACPAALSGLQGRGWQHCAGGGGALK